MKQPFIITLLVVTLSSCWGGTPSSASSMFSFSEFDYFNKIESNKTLRRQYVVHRQFSVQDHGDFTGSLLNPLNYPEDLTIQPYYRVANAIEGDFSSENISFANKNNIILDYLLPLNNKRLSSTELNGLLAILNQNDEFINTQSIFYYDRNLSEDLDQGSYYAFNNFFRQENSIFKRYQNNIVEGVGQGSILYQDGFDVEFSIQTQIFANESRIYQLRDETFPPGLRTAQDSKATSIRVTGNFKQALTIGGGGQAQRFIHTYTSLYQSASLNLDPNQYAYTLRADTTPEQTKITFYIYRPVAGLFQTQTLQDMTLTYEVYIREGVVTDIVARQSLFQG